MANFLDVIGVLLDEGIEITMKKHDGRVWYDLNVQAKSHLWITQNKPEEIEYHMRYQEGTLDCTLTGVLDLARQARCGRDFMSTSWLGLLSKHSFLTKKVVEVVTYE